MPCQTQHRLFKAQNVNIVVIKYFILVKYELVRITVDLMMYNYCKNKTTAS